MNGASGDLYRAAKRNRHGDPVDEDGNPLDVFDKDGNGFLGTLTDIVVGAISSDRVNDRQESSDGRGQLGFKKNGKTSTGAVAPQVKFGDRIQIDNTWFEITSDAHWVHPHSMSGTVFQRYWVDVTYRR